MDAEMHSCVGLGTLCADFWSVTWLLIKLNSQVGRRQEPQDYCAAEDVAQIPRDTPQCLYLTQKPFHYTLKGRGKESENKTKLMHF